jgi:hypothetical protein
MQELAWTSQEVPGSSTGKFGRGIPADGPGGQRALADYGGSVSMTRVAMSA